MGGRWWRHLATDDTAVRRLFGAEGLDRVGRAITEGERAHRGQVRFAVEAALPLRSVFRRVSPRARALEVFSLSRTWDTEENCGVLVYVLVADRKVEIIADRGIHRSVAAGTWEGVCRTMEAAFREARFAEGAETGVREISRILAEQFPASGERSNELPDAPIVL
ncbi:MAG: TPM domain-containing protein [Pseudomonadota bacterium]|nr:TPM domain-containing protein [Pseudomonadota bacterium]